MQFLHASDLHIVSPLRGLDRYEGAPVTRLRTASRSALERLVDKALEIGLLHTSLTGRPGHDTYAPTDLATLVAKGYVYWALGHVHAREVVSEGPRVVFPGNLQGRHANETGAKGCELVTVEAGRVEAEFVALDVARWNQVVVPLDGLDRLEALSDAVREALEPVLVGATDRASNDY